VRGLDGAARRLVLAHASGALALSMPWPLLLVLVAEHSDDPLLLGLAGAARMLPYVVCSWVAGRLADAVRRDVIVQATLAGRCVLFALAAGAVATDHVWVAVLACTSAVAVATPAFPALVAAMPGVAGMGSRRATDLLVTVEVAGFVVGASVGGLLLHPATRGAAAWVPVALCVVAMALLRPVSMPRPRRTGVASRPSAYDALRRSPAARQAIAVMAAVNFAVALLALALLPMALHAWSSDATGYGVAAGVLGFAALGAPLLAGIGRTTGQCVRRGLVVVAVGLLLLAPTSGIVWALVPLAVVGAASVAVEAAATGVLQDELPDEVRATVLGLNDTIIIAAALAGTVLAPVAVAGLGGTAVLGVLGVAVGVVAAWVRPRPRAHAPATVGPGLLEPGREEDRGPQHDASAHVAVVCVPAPRHGDDRPGGVRRVARSRRTARLGADPGQLLDGDLPALRGPG
jgi:MFS family permease